MLRHIKEIVDPSKIDYIISNHAEPDHSGSLAKFHKEEAPQATRTSKKRRMRARSFDRAVSFPSENFRPV